MTFNFDQFDPNKSLTANMRGLADAYYGGFVAPSLQYGAERMPQYFGALDQAYYAMTPAGVSQSLALSYGDMARQAQATAQPYGARLAYQTGNPHLALMAQGAAMNQARSAYNQQVARAFDPMATYDRSMAQAQAVGPMNFAGSLQPLFGINASAMQSKAPPKKSAWEQLGGIGASIWGGTGFK